MTATSGATKRLAGSGNADTAPGIAPRTAHSSDAGSKTSQSSFGTGPADVITQTGKYNADSALSDARRNGVQIVTLTGFASTDSFTMTLKLADGTRVTTIPFVRGTNATAAAIQAELRTLISGTDLTVVAGTTDEGPFTVTFNADGFYSRRYPVIETITGTGCTGAVTAPRTSQPLGGHLGESRFDGDGVGPGNALTGPAIGTITVTGGTDEVQTLAFSAGTDGGQVALQFRRGIAVFDWDADGYAIDTAIANMFDQNRPYLSAADAPTVALVTPHIMELDFGDWAAGDDITVSFNDGGGADPAAAALTFDAVDAAADAAARCALVKAHLLSIPDLAALVESDAIVVTENTENVDYSVTFTKNTDIINTQFTVADTGATPDASPDSDQALDLEAGWTFTFEAAGALAGIPVRGGIRLFSPLNTTEDGGVQEDPTITVTTPGVLGSISAAYTELATYGDSVLVEARRDADGKTYGAQLDAASPAVISSLPPGVYTLYARTYDAESHRVGPVSSKAFTVTSS